MKYLHKISAAVGALVLSAIFVITPITNAAYLNNPGLNMNLGQLVTLDALFNSQNASNSQNTTQQNATDQNDQNAKSGILDNLDLNKLIALNTVFGNTVTVQRGDTLTAIAKQFLGDASRYREIADLNGLANANRIYTGQQLRLPAIAGTNDLSRLVVLQDLFNKDKSSENEKNYSLTDLMILSTIFGSGMRY